MSQNVIQIGDFMRYPEDESSTTRKINQWIKKGKVERIGKTRSIRFRLILI